MGREGQQGLGLSVQEQGAYDQGRRERNRAMEAFSQPQGGGSGGGGAIALLIALAPALAAPGLLVMATWTHVTEALGWDWPFALVIAIAEVVGLIWVTGLFYAAMPAVIVAIVVSLYLGGSYAICAPLFFSADVMWTVLLGVGAGALGYLAGLAAPNKWMSSRLITSGAAVGTALAIMLVLQPAVMASGFPLWVAMAVRWAAVGLLAGVLLHTLFWTKWTFFGSVAVIALLIWQAPGFLEELVTLALGAGSGPGI